MLRVVFILCFPVLALAQSAPVFSVWKYDQYNEWEKKLFDFERQAKFVPDTSGPVWAPDCDQKGERRIGNLNLPKATLSSPLGSSELSFPLTKPSNHIQDHFELFKKTTIGKEVVLVFEPKHKDGRIEIKYFSDNEKSRNMKAQAICKCEPDKKQIYVDRFAEVGELATSLLHESIHAVDPELHKGQLKRRQLFKQLFGPFKAMVEKTPQAKSGRWKTLRIEQFPRKELEKLWQLRYHIDQYIHILHFRSEMRAYHFTRHAMIELFKFYPDYYKAYGTPPVVDDKFLLEHYGFKRQHIERYRKGRCQKVPFLN